LAIIRSEPATDTSTSASPPKAPRGGDVIGPKDAEPRQQLPDLTFNTQAQPAVPGGGRGLGVGARARHCRRSETIVRPRHKPLTTHLLGRGICSHQARPDRDVPTPMPTQGKTRGAPFVAANT